jgi:hypothetical protein
VEWISLAVALAGAGIAVFIPLFVEYTKRPALEIALADDLNIEDRLPKQRLVHIRVINRPLAGRRGAWLLRNVATGCTVDVEIISRRDHQRISFAGRWSANPEPWTFAAGDRVIAQIFDPTKIASTRVFDLPPSTQGSSLAVAIKVDGQEDAYGFASESYGWPQLRNPAWTLSHATYDVRVVARAGGLEAKQDFVLRNDGPRYADLELKNDG